MATTALTWRTPLPSTNGTYRAKPGSPGDTHPPLRGTHAMQTGRVGDSLGRSRPAPPCTLRTGRPAGDGCGGRRDRSACHRGPARSLGACVLSDRAAWPLGPGLEPPWWRTAGERALRACSHLSLKAGCTHFDTARGFGGLGVSYKISRGGRTAARAHRECAAPTPPDPGSSLWPPCGPVAWPGLVLWVTLRSSLSGTDLSVLSSVTPAN